MEKMYQAYKRTVNGKTFYFIKQYIVFPDYKDVAPVLETYSMHINFIKACNIARIYDVDIQNMLSKQLGIQEPEAMELAEQSRAAVYSFKWKTAMHVVPSVLRLIRLRS